jgi:hypothetical protein
LKTFLFLVALVLSSGCTTFKSSIEDHTKLEGPATGDLGRELEVRVTAPEALRRAIYRAVVNELEVGDLFDEVFLGVEAPDGGVAPLGSATRPARLELELLSAPEKVVKDFWQQRDGYVARYEFTCRVVDRTGAVVLSGPLTGLAYDDATDPDVLDEVKREDVREAARRTAIVRVARQLHRAAEKRVDQALKEIPRVKLPDGVGPVAIAAIGFDDDPAARHRRGPQLTRAVAGALNRLGADLKVVAPEEVENELGADPTTRPREFSNLTTEELDRLVPRLGARLYVSGKVSADGHRVTAHAMVRDTSLVTLGECDVAAEGPGALGMVAVEIARKLGAAIEAKPPGILPKRDDSD